MKIIRHLTWQNMKHSKARTIVTILGIILSAAMFTAVTTMGISFRAYLMEATVAEDGDYFVCYNYGTMEDLQKLRQEKSVTKLGTVNTIGYTSFQYETESRSVDDTFIIGAGDREFFEMMPVGLVEGRLPETGSELMITGAVQEYLRESGQPCELGAQITLPIAVSYETKDVVLPVVGKPYEKTFTIVGVSEYVQYFADNRLDLSSLLTYDDGSEAGIWGRFFVKSDPKEAYALAKKPYGSSCAVNQNLLDFYGVTKYYSINDLIVTFAAILIGIIMAGSVTLIYNAFSISVSERTKQFGLLSSVGATRKQIRQSVFTEAVGLAAFGIPIGIFCGYAGIAITLKLTHGLIDNLLLSAKENNIILQAVPSIPAFVLAGLVALVTVFISAWIPARRATKITPIAAIRQTREFIVPKYGVQAGKLTQKFFGLPASLARKYYTVNKRKYRATIISLTISMVLFVTAGSFVQQLNGTVEEQANTDNFDFEIIVNSMEQVEQLRAHPAVGDSALVSYGHSRAAIPEVDFDQDYTTAWEAMAQAYRNTNSISSKYVRINYLEDSVLQKFLIEQGIDPTPYLDSEEPLALTTDAQLTWHLYDESGRPVDRKNAMVQVLRDDVDTISLIPTQVPDGVLNRLERIMNESLRIEPDGTVLLTVMVPPEVEDGTSEDLRYDIEIRTVGNGTDYAYYIRDPKTGIAEEEPADVVSVERSQLRLGANIRELPLGISPNTDLGAITVILPLSSAPAETDTMSLMATASDYKELLAFLEEQDYSFVDRLEGQMEYRNYITMIRIFSYGFITLISLICICNVFNTISTNIALRRKDFGMLRSVGMKNREIDHMMAFECLQYGLKAMLWGIPLSIFTSLLIARRVGQSDFALPIHSIFIAASFIFVTVFITMFYAVSKLKKENPMEAIRSES